MKYDAIIIQYNNGKFVSSVWPSVTVEIDYGNHYPVAKWRIKKHQ